MIQNIGVLACILYLIRNDTNFGYHKILGLSTGREKWPLEAKGLGSLALKIDVDNFDH